MRPRPRSWNEPPGKRASRVRRSLSARVWSRFLRSRVAFSWSDAIWWRARPRVEGGQALLHRRHLALDGFAGPGERGLDLGIGVPRPAGHERLGIALQIGQ